MTRKLTFVQVMLSLSALCVSKYTPCFRNKSDLVIMRVFLIYTECINPIKNYT